MSDSLLWNELRQGNHEALETIYRTYFKQLYNYGRRFACDEATVEDCLQELFVELWSKRQNLSETNAILPYLYVSLKRKIIKSVRNIRKSTDVEFSDIKFNVDLSIESSILAADETEENRIQLQEAFKHLSSRQKEIVYLKFYSGMDYEGISELMDLNYQSARNLVARALQKLQKYMVLIVLYLLFT